MFTKSMHRRLPPTMRDCSLKRQGRQRLGPRMSPRVFLVQLLVLASLLLLVTASEAETENSQGETCDNPELVKSEAPKIRMITPEELATKNGVDETTIWISIIGEVYDVTEGQEHYAPGKSYSAFAGRDASVPFCTGKFTAEEAQKGPDALQDSELPALADWRDFYRMHQVYKFVGRLIDPRYFSETGEPTEPMMQLHRRIQVARVEHELKARQRREEREKKKRGKKEGVR